MSMAQSVMFTVRESANKIVLLGGGLLKVVRRLSEMRASVGVVTAIAIVIIIIIVHKNNSLFLI